MAQGLFTAGTSVEELLAKRNTRANALQQSLMANAAQGAARPMEAQAYSLLGSSLGRALAGKMGGEDKQMEALKAKEAQQGALQQEALAVSGGTIAEKRAFIAKIAPIYPEYAQDLTDKVNAQVASKADKAIIKEKYDKEQARKDAALGLTAQNKLEDNLAESVKLEQNRMEKKDAADALVQSQNNAIDMLGPNADKGLVKAIKSGDKEALKIGWKRVTDLEAEGNDAREVARIYGKGYEVGTELNKKKLREKFEKSGGTTVQVYTGEREAVDTDGYQYLSSKQHSKMQEDLISTQSQLTKLQTIKEKFDPSHFGAIGDARAAWGDLLDYAGIDTETRYGGDAVKFAAQRNLSQAEIGQLFNVYRREVTGAAAAVAELKAIEKVYLNSKKGPAATLVMLDALLRVTSETESTQQETLKRGVRVSGNTDPLTMSDAEIIAAWNALQPK
jgi:hypothetical protein